MADGGLAMDHIDTSVVSLAIACHRHHHHHHPLFPYFRKISEFQLTVAMGEWQFQQVRIALEAGSHKPAHSGPWCDGHFLPGFEAGGRLGQLPCATKQIPTAYPRRLGKGQ